MLLRKSHLSMECAFNFHRGVAKRRNARAIASWYDDRMPISWTTENSEYDTVRVSGLLTWKEFEQLHESIDDPPDPGQKINTLVLLDQFEGWDQAESWGELRYVARNEAILKKVAIVGDEKWRDQWELFMFKGLSPVEIEYYAPKELNLARVWLETD
jgi:hypothetical protein